MSISTRIKGQALTLEIDGADYAADISSAVLDNEEASSDVVTFADVASGGGRQFFITTTAVQSTDADSFWSTIWDHSGQIVNYTFAVHGNAVPTPAQPHFTGTVKIPPKPKLGGDANTTYTFESRFDCQEVPTKVTA